MRQTAIWIDHEEARVFHVQGDSFDKDTVHAANHHFHRHPKSQETKERNHPKDEPRFFEELLAVLGDSEEILLMGPSMTKLHFLRYAQKHAHGLADRIVGIESADHPTDKQVAAHVRHYFGADSPRLGVVAS